jgi:hypothetical protein
MFMFHRHLFLLLAAVGCTSGGADSGSDTGAYHPQNPIGLGPAAIDLGALTDPA